MTFSLADPKAQFLLYNRWSQEVEASSPTTKKVKGGHMSRGVQGCIHVSTRLILGS